MVTLSELTGSNPERACAPGRELDAQSDDEPPLGPHELRKGASVDAGYWGLQFDPG